MTETLEDYLVNCRSWIEQIANLRESYNPEPLVIEARRKSSTFEKKSCPISTLQRHNHTPENTLEPASQTRMSHFL